MSEPRLTKCKLLRFDEEARVLEFSVDVGDPLWSSLIRQTRFTRDEWRDLEREEIQLAVTILLREGAKALERMTHDDYLRLLREDEEHGFWGDAEDAD